MRQAFGVVGGQGVCERGQQPLGAVGVAFRGQLGAPAEVRQEVGHLLLAGHEMEFRHNAVELEAVGIGVARVIAAAGVDQAAALIVRKLPVPDDDEVEVVGLR